MNDEQINLILNDLYAIDPEFKKHESEIRSIIEQLLELKPAAEIDENFKHQLKYNLIEKLGNMEIKNRNNNFDKAKFFRYFIPGIALMILLVLAGGYLYKTGGMKFAQNLRPSEKKNAIADFSKVKITGANDLAFGSLAGGSAGSSSTTAPTANSTNSNGKAMGLAPAPNFMPATGFGGGGGIAAPNMRIRQPMYKFEYKGDPIDLPDAKLDVLKKDQPGLQGSDASALVGSMGFGLANLSSFDNAQLQQFSIAQEVPFGYNINVSLTDSSISIYQQWDQWPNACKQDVCPPIQPLTPDKIPDNATLIGIAKDFVSEHQINVDAYGDPIIQTDYRRIYYATPSAMRADFYVPDQINVLYPLVVNGKTVFDGSGNPMGMTVGVDIRNNKVASVWNITSHTYQASAYDAETDFQKLVDYADKGGYNGVYYSGANENYTTLELETPSIQWMDYYQYKEGVSTELLVPALVFPIKDAPADLYQKNVVVPLITDILNNLVSPPPTGIAVPMNK